MLEVINRINTQTKEMFKTTFEQIRNNFRTMFTEVFGSGKADLILVDENDVDGLAQAIRGLYQSAQLRRELGENNRLLSERLFSAHNAERSAHILNRLMNSSCEAALPDLQREMS